MQLQQEAENIVPLYRTIVVKNINIEASYDKKTKVQMLCAIISAPVMYLTLVLTILNS